MQALVALGVVLELVIRVSSVLAACVLEEY